MIDTSILNLKADDKKLSLLTGAFRLLLLKKRQFSNE